MAAHPFAGAALITATLAAALAAGRRRMPALCLLLVASAAVAGLATPWRARSADRDFQSSPGDLVVRVASPGKPPVVSRLVAGRASNLPVAPGLYLQNRIALLDPRSWPACRSDTLSNVECSFDRVAVLTASKPRSAIVAVNVLIVGITPPEDGATRMAVAHLEPGDFVAPRCRRSGSRTAAACPELLPPRLLALTGDLDGRGTVDLAVLDRDDGARQLVRMNLFERPHWRNLPRKSDTASAPPPPCSTSMRC